MGNGNSSSKNKAILQTEQGNGPKVSAFRDEYIDIAISDTLPLRGKHGLGNAPVLDNDDTFNDYIRREEKNQKHHHVNNVWEESNTAPPPVELASGSSSKEENEKEQFSKFVQITKKKLRSIRNNSLFHRGERT